MDSPDAVPLPSPEPPPSPARPAGVRRDRASFAPAPARRASTGIHFPTGPVAPLAHALLLLGATAAVFLAGKPQQGSMGIFLVCAGVAMVACPPRIAVSWRLWAAAAGLVGCAALALLPEHLVTQPAWRHALETTPPIVLPGTISAVPALTGFWLAVLAISLLAGLFLLAQPLRSRWLLTFALLAATAVGIYAVLAICARETGWHYPFTAGTSFGFFPNRNHTADFLCVGCLLAVGVLGIVLREARWLAALLAGAALAAGAAGLMFFSESRAGIVFLLAGIGLWIAGLGRQHRDGRLVVSAAAVLVAGGILFLMAGGQARDRLLGKRQPANVAATAATATGGDEGLHNLSSDFRLNIYRDTADAIRDFPVTGMGLGAFPLVFHQYRRVSLTDIGVGHPESDWLMLAAEAGVPAVLCLLALVALAAGQLRAESGHAQWPLRWGCAVAAGVAAMHGLIDVPWHRVQLGWWLLAVAGLALQSARTGPLARSRFQHAVFIAGGVAALALGGMLVRAQWFGGPPLPPFAAEKAQADILDAFKRQDIAGATTLARQAVQASPLVVPLYYQLGTLLLRDDDNDAEVDRVFRAQRQIDPAWTVISLQQGDAWLSIDPERTATLWLDALARRQRIDLADGAPPDDALNFYRELFDRAGQFPAVRRPLGRAALQSPAFALVWLEKTGAGIQADDWSRLTGSPGFLQRFSGPERQRFLLLWDANAGSAAVERFVSGHPDWQAAAWPVHLRELVAAGQLEAAVRAAAAHYQVPLDLHLPAAPETGVSAANAAEDNPLAEFASDWRAGNGVSARRVLEEAKQAAGQKPLPPEYWQTRLAVAVQDQNWPQAWESLKNEVRATHPGDLPLP